ncbi:ADP-ribosylation factor-like protein 14 [Callorhinchus milii]|uniref:ADP-ribosylation factor-like protein 14 n=1 Tax=Callorhinchus milii TaxID=7868 RepID=A0A4W3K119_CALMI|nr:ADP-ribosylation factor-like protein 14 [Callorhinchus milii]|eukprot:gi/632934872/ref/XP_007886762.1/ PREDICTED: ADP-ribosylation factor-like protein 14 [Callorhinchus milii]
MGLLTSKESKRKQARVIMLGLNAAGKSTLLYKLKFGETEHFTVPTIGFNVEMLEADKQISLTVWDVGGQRKLRQFWPHYFQNTDGIVYVVDSADKAHLEESKKEFESLLKHEHLKGVPVVVLANKQDLPNAMTADEVTRRLRLKRCCSDRDWYVQPCCAKTGQGLSAAMKTIILHVKRKVNYKDEGAHPEFEEDRL